MAIKGKRKPKARSGRVVTPGRRPAYVPPKVPLFQRTGAKLTVALVIETIVFALIIGFAEESMADRRRAAIQEFTSLVEASLGGAGQAIQPLPTGALVLPQLGTRLTELGGDSPDTETIMAEAEAGSEAVANAAQGVAAVEVPREDLEPLQSRDLTEARTLMQRGLLMYAELARQVAVAASIEDGPPPELITTIQNQLQLAGQTFSEGYGRLQFVRTQAGLSTVATVPGGGFPEPVPPGFDPTAPLPGEEVPIEVEPGGGGGGGSQGGGGKGKGGGGGGNG